MTGRTFYVDFEAGDDANPGTAPDRPWKHAPGSPEKAVTLSAGDRVLVRNGAKIYDPALNIAVPADGAGPPQSSGW